MITISFIRTIAEFVGAVLMVLPDNHEAIREVPLVLVGAVLMVLPDIPYVKSFIFSSTLEDARRELFDTSSLTEGSDEFEALADLMAC